MRFFAITFKTLSLGITHNIHPVTGPFFSVLRFGQQRLDEPGPSLGRAVLFEAFDLFGSGRQADEIVISTADKLGFGGARVGLQSRLTHRLEEKRIHRIARPIRARHSRRRKLAYRLICPPIRGVGWWSWGFVGYGYFRGTFQSGVVRGAQREPFLENRQLRIGTFAGRRHFMISIPITHHIEKEAFGWSRSV